MLVAATTTAVTIATATAMVTAAATTLAMTSATDTAAVATTTTTAAVAVAANCGGGKLQRRQTAVAENCSGGRLQLQWRGVAVCGSGVPTLIKQKMPPPGIKPGGVAGPPPNATQPRLPVGKDLRSTLHVRGVIPISHDQKTSLIYRGSFSCVRRRVRPSL